MKIAFMSYQADALDVAFRIALEGHQVTTYVENEEDNDCFDGILRKAKTWQEAVKGSDLLIFDDNKINPIIWESCHRDIDCFGGSPFARRLENDRKFAHDLMKRCGIERVESLSFKTLKEALGHLKEHQQAHVVKPSGPEVKSHHLIVGDDEDGADAIGQVERLIEQGLKVDSVEVEERKRGVEVGLSMFFNGYNPVGPVNVNFEHKRSYDQEKGYLTGEMGTLCKWIEDPNPPFFQETLAKVIPALRAARYQGVIDLNMIVGRDEHGERFVAPLEFTPRLGKPISFILDELHVTPWVDLMHACAIGKRYDNRVHYDWGVGVNLCSFGFPFREMEHVSRGLEVQGLDADTLEHLHPIEVKLDNKGRFIHCPGVGEVLCATGRGESILRAKERAYENLSRVKLPNSFHRWDISDKIATFELENLDILPREESHVL